MNLGYIEDAASGVLSQYLQVEELLPKNLEGKKNQGAVGALGDINDKRDDTHCLAQNDTRTLFYLNS